MTRGTYRGQQKRHVETRAGSIQQTGPTQEENRQGERKETKQVTPPTFLPIRGVKGHRVGTDGSVWTCLMRISMGHCRGSIFVPGPGWRKRKLTPDKKGYLRVTLPLEEGGSTRVKIHTLVLVTFVGPRPPGMECRHLDHCKTHNWTTNLAWGTPEQNRDDARIGRWERAIAAFTGTLVKS